MSVLSLIPRSSALPARVVVGVGAAAKKLALAIVTNDERLHGLRVAVASDLLVAEGPTELLPWADGAQYLAADEACPALFLPTTRAPSVPASLAEAALRRGLGLPRGRLGVLLDGTVINLELALTASAERLRAWAESGS